MTPAIALWAAIQLTGLQPEFVKLFQPLEYRYSGGQYENALFRYRLFVPELSSDNQRLPLIVWLHGRGERGEDNAYHLRWLDELVMPPPWRRDRFPFFVLAVQCPIDNSYWTRHRDEAGAHDDMVNVVAAILEEVLRTQQVDPDRVYLSGLSTGGSGCWRLAMRYPEYFAAIAPLASRGTSDQRILQLRDTPIWAFHSSRDKSSSPEYVRTSVTMLHEIGGNVRLTEIDSDEHNCWSAAYGEYRLLDWLLAQRRGSPIWQWWQILLQACLLALIPTTGWGLVRLRHYLRSRQRTAAPPPTVVGKRAARRGA